MLNIKVELIKKIKQQRSETVTIGDIMWQDNIAAKSTILNFKDSKNYCKNLKIGYYDDWRLPTHTQLKSLVNNVNKIQNIAKWFYWSSYVRKDKKSVWGVNFEKENNIKKNAHTFKTYTQYVRCVRDKKVSK